MRVLTEEKRNVIIDAAGRSFLKHGFGGATIDLIAKDAKASKATFYRYFPSKEDVFKAYIIRAGEGHMRELETAFKVSPTTDESLFLLGKLYLSLLLSPTIMGVNRLVIGEAKRFPQLTELYFNNGPKRVIDFLEDALKEISLAGELTLHDSRKATWHFMSLCELRMYERALWGFDDNFTQEEIDEHLRQIVPNFVNLMNSGAIEG